MIRFGPAGIPLSCKGRTLKDGIEDVHSLSLSALEIQMVRAATYFRSPDDDEVGKTIRDIKEDFVVGILREGGLVSDTDEPIAEDDDLACMPSPVARTFGSLYEIGHMAQRMDVKLSIHTPYYMDLGGDDENLVDGCMGSIMYAGTIMNALDGDIVVTSLGIYEEGCDREAVDDNIYENLASVVDWWKCAGLKPRLGIEVTGQQDVFGSLEQVLDICENVGDVVPVVNFAHMHSRTDGRLLEVDDFLNLLEQVEPYCKGGIHTAFSGVEYADGNERRVTPIKKGDLRFDPLAEALVEMRPDCTVVSTSPLLEHDATYMKTILERVVSKRVAKALKEKRKSESAAPAAGERVGEPGPDPGMLQGGCEVRRSRVQGASSRCDSGASQDLHLRLRKVRPRGPDVCGPPGPARPGRAFHRRDDDPHDREGRPYAADIVHREDFVGRADGADRQAHRVGDHIGHRHPRLPARGRLRLQRGHGRARRRRREGGRPPRNGVRGFGAPVLRLRRRRDNEARVGHRERDARTSRDMGAIARTRARTPVCASPNPRCRRRAPRHRGL